jgi:hypothetical protein
LRGKFKENQFFAQLLRSSQAAQAERSFVAFQHACLVRTLQRPLEKIQN